MTILNRYILKKFIGPFLGIFGLLLIIIFVSQIIERLDRFLADGVNFSHVFGFLLTSMPFQALQILPIASFMATLFVVGNLARTREYIAGLAGGVAPEKFLGGLFWAGFVLSLLAFMANETIIPAATRYSRQVYREKIRRLGEWKQNLFYDHFVSGSEGRIWTAKLFNQDTGYMQRVVIDTFVNGKVGTQIDALKAKKVTNGWTFYTGSIREFGPDGITILKTEQFDKKNLRYTERPSDLVTQEPQPEQMNYKKLKRHVKRLSALGIPVRKLKVELMMKLAFPFSCFVVTLLGVPLAMRGKGNWGWGIAMALVVTLSYMVCMQFGKALALRFIPPILGAWMANIIFLIMGYWLWMRMRQTA
ncbi:hypothetical protein BVX98_04070 [bacterium F11]|nr:hypothetical protein BVX98_04070 [bacterium F11]